MNGLTRHQAAVILGTTDQTITNYCKSGLLGYCKGAKNILYVNADDVEKYKEKLKMIAASERLIELKRKQLSEERGKLDEQLVQVRNAMRFGITGFNANIASDLVSRLFNVMYEIKPRERDIVCEFVKGDSLKDIAERRNISLERARQILKKAVGKFEDFARIQSRLHYYCDLSIENDILKEEIRILRDKYEPSLQEQEMRKLTALLATKLGDHNASVRVLNAIKSSGWGDTIGDLLKHSKHDLMSLRNFGAKSLREVIDIIDGLGLDFPLYDEKEDEFYKRMIDKQNERNITNENKVQ